jgi:alcohol dehydrogenase, propanol-preferring
MRAARIHEDLSLRVDEIDAPTPGPGEVVVRIHAAGVCGTDLHILDGMIKPDPYPMTLGHEAAGVVESVGDGASLTTGSRVAIYNKIFCGRCEQCLKGRTNICDNEPEQLGFNRDGGDAEYVVVPEQNAVPVPDDVDLAAASVLTCAGMTAVHATRLSGLSLGDAAVVNGIGGVGVIVVQAAAHAGARVIAIGDSEEKLDLARSHGASDGVLVDSSESYETVPDRVRALTDGRGTDVFFELVGTTQTMNAGIRSLAKGGRFVSTGYTDQSLEIHPIEFILSETSFVSTVAATRLDLQDALMLAAAGALTVPVARRYPLEGIHDALDALRRRAVLGRQVLELTN